MAVKVWPGIVRMSRTNGSVVIANSVSWCVERREERSSIYVVQF
jgi:hypothetical protein